VKAGDTVLIRFPHADLGAGKLRPALVVATVPGRHMDLLLALITSRLYQAVPDFDEIIAEDEADFRSSGLKTRSVIRLTRLATVDSAIINARLGKISSERLDKIRARLATWLLESPS